jgi:hypothetical protein
MRPGARNQIVHLTPFEIMVASLIGSLRRVKSLKGGRFINPYSTRDDWDMEIDGAAAEIAVAKYLGVYWEPSVNTFKAPDVGTYQVRSTPLQHGCLIVRSNDKDTETYVLVICETATRYRIVGMMTGADAKQIHYFKDASTRGVKAWWVPQGDLFPLPERGAA